MEKKKGLKLIYSPHPSSLLWRRGDNKEKNMNKLSLNL
jgi:hypothetical protein